MGIWPDDDDDERRTTKTRRASLTHQWTGYVLLITSGAKRTSGYRYSRAFCFGGVICVIAWSYGRSRKLSCRVHRLVVMGRRRCVRSRHVIRDDEYAVWWPFLFGQHRAPGNVRPDGALRHTWRGPYESTMRENTTVENAGRFLPERFPRTVYRRPKAVTAAPSRRDGFFYRAPSTNIEQKLSGRANRTSIEAAKRFRIAVRLILAAEEHAENRVDREQTRTSVAGNTRVCRHTPCIARRVVVLAESPTTTPPTHGDFIRRFYATKLHVQTAIFKWRRLRWIPRTRTTATGRPNLTRYTNEWCIIEESVIVGYLSSREKVVFASRRRSSLLENCLN